VPVLLGPVEAVDVAMAGATWTGDGMKGRVAGGVLNGFFLHPKIGLRRPVKNGICVDKNPPAQGVRHYTGRITLERYY
jgi:hypothetical protein